MSAQHNNIRSIVFTDKDFFFSQRKNSSVIYQTLHDAEIKAKKKKKMKTHFYEQINRIYIIIIKQLCYSQQQERMDVIC